MMPSLQHILPILLSLTLPIDIFPSPTYSCPSAQVRQEGMVSTKQVQAVLGAKNKEIEKLNSKIEELKKRYKASFEDIEKSNKMEKEALLHEIDNLEKELEINIPFLKSELHREKAKIVLLKKEQARLIQEHTDSETKNNQEKRQIEAHHTSQLERQEEEINKKTQKIAEKEKEIKNLNTKLQKLQSELTESKERQQQILSRAEEVMKKSEALESENQTLQKALSETKKIEEDHNKQKAIISALQSAIQELESNRTNHSQQSSTESIETASLSNRSSSDGKQHTKLNERSQSPNPSKVNPIPQASEDSTHASLDNGQTIVNIDALHTNRGTSSEKDSPSLLEEINPNSLSPTNKEESQEGNSFHRERRDSHADVTDVKILRRDSNNSNLDEKKQIVIYDDYDKSSDEEMADKMVAIEELNRQLNTMRNLTTRQNKKIAKLKREITALKKGFAICIKNLNQARLRSTHDIKEVNELREQTKNLNGLLRKAENQYQETEKKVHQLTHTLEEEKKLSVEKNEKVTQLEEALAGNREENCQQLATLDKAKETHKEQTHLITTLLQKEKTLTQKNNQLAEENSQLKERLAAMERTATKASLAVRTREEAPTPFVPATPTKKTRQPITTREQPKPFSHQSLPHSAAGFCLTILLAYLLKPTLQNTKRTPLSTL